MQRALPKDFTDGEPQAPDIRGEGQGLRGLEACVGDWIIQGVNELNLDSFWGLNAVPKSVNERRRVRKGRSHPPLWHHGDCI